LYGNRVGDLEPFGYGNRRQVVNLDRFRGQRRGKLTSQCEQRARQEEKQYKAILQHPGPFQPGLVHFEVIEKHNITVIQPAHQPD
jgi:hypothetical protein